MCMAIPSQIRSIDGVNATVECFGVSRVVNLMLLPEPAAVGDYVIVQAGGFAMEKLEPADALEALDYFARVLVEP
ncbi:MAG TPA: HypC/HybG/HupF family hydrogenase formation chaperone [Rhodospirillaceae bacterium]|nr:HypC/HybG/HupF family hydrogenase formation chaperone [Rhodospirillaceae bacterium]